MKKTSLLFLFSLMILLVFSCTNPSSPTDNEEYSGTWFGSETNPNTGELEDVDKWMITDNSYEYHYLYLGDGDRELQPFEKGSITKEGEDLVFKPTHVYADEDTIADVDKLNGENPGWFSVEDLLELGFSDDIREEFESWMWEYKVEDDTITFTLSDEPGNTTILTKTEPIY